MVYDVAPEAEYLLATGVYFNDLSRVVDWFNSNDVDVVVASLSTLFEGPGNGTSPYTNRFIAAINRGVSLGMTFAISAGNENDRSWFGRFVDSDNDRVLDWADSDECNRVYLVAGRRYTFRFRWDGTWRGATTDLDLYLTRGGTVQAKSENAQSGGGPHDPQETMGYTAGRTGNYCLTVEQRSGSIPRWAQLVVLSLSLDITIEDVNERPVAVADPSVTTNEDTAVTFDVLGNDTDPDEGDTLTVRSTSRPSSGGVVVESSTQMLIYTLAKNVHGTFTFTYTASDGTFTSASALVTITVDPVNDAPTFAASPPALRVSESAVAGDIVGAVTATDVEGDTLTYRLSGTGAFAFDIEPDSGQIKVADRVDIAMQDTYEVTVEADDGSNEANATASVDVIITVTTGPVAPPSGGGGGFGGGGGGGATGGPAGPSPSEVDFEWTVKRDIEELDSGNDWPTGLWSDGATLWILENGQGADDDIYAYDPRTGERHRGAGVRARRDEPRAARHLVGPRDGVGLRQRARPGLRLQAGERRARREPRDRAGRAQRRRARHLVGLRDDVGARREQERALRLRPRHWRAARRVRARFRQRRPARHLVRRRLHVRRR